MKFHTRTLTAGSLTINAIDGAMSVSVQANDSSSATIAGNLTFQGVNSSAITIENGEALTITAPSPASPLDGLTINWGGGTVDVIIGF